MPYSMLATARLALGGRIEYSSSSELPELPRQRDSLHVEYRAATALARPYSTRLDNHGTSSHHPVDQFG